MIRKVRRRLVGTKQYAYIYFELIFFKILSLAYNVYIATLIP